MRSTLVGLLALLAAPALAAGPLPEGAVARLGATEFRTGGTGLVLSPDGTRAAVRVGDTIDVLSLDTGEVVATLRDEKKLRHPRLSRGPHWFTFAFAAGGKEIVTATHDDEVWVWDAATGKPLRSIRGPQYDDVYTIGKKLQSKVSTVFNCQLGDFVVCETWGVGWQKLDVKTGKWSDIRGGWDRISDVSPDGRWVTDYTDMASVENYVAVIDTTTNKSVYGGESGGSYPFNATPSPDGKFVACTTDEAGVQVWEVATRKEIKLKDVTPKNSFGGPTFSPDGKTVIAAVPASVYDEKTPPYFARWDVTTGERLPDWKVPARVTSWVIDHKNNRLVAIAGQGIFRIDLATGKVLAPPEGFTGSTRSTISPDGRLAAVGDSAGVIRLYESPFTGKPRTLGEAGPAVQDITFSKDGKTLFAAHPDGTVGVWDVAAGKRTATLKPATPVAVSGAVRSMQVAVSPDGKTVVAEMLHARLWAWDAESGKVLWEVHAGVNGMGVVGCRPVFAPDGSAVYYGRGNGQVSKFDPRTGRELGRVEVPGMPRWNVNRLAVSADGKRFAATSYHNDTTLVLFDWELKSPSHAKLFKYEEAVGGMEFTPDGSALVTAHSNGTVRGWRTANPEKPTFSFRGPAGYSSGLQITGDGKYAITNAPGATAIVWKLK
jgi:WD40 repeat protein